MIRRFARPYARAIMDVTETPQKANELRLELQRFEDARKGSADLQEVFANPGIEAELKLRVARTIAQRLGLSEMAVKVLDVLIRNHRINKLSDILAALQAYSNAAMNIVVAEVRSAHQLSQDEIAGLQRTLETKIGKHVEVQLSTDPTLLGGFVARIGSEILDASVVGKIQKFRASLA